MFHYIDDMVDIVIQEGKTPLGLAVRKNHLIVCKYLLLNDYDIEELLADKEVIYDENL